MRGHACGGRGAVEDVYARAAGVVEGAILHGTTRLRTFVEVDPGVGFRAFEAIKAIRRDYAFAIDIEICAFAQEGLTQEPRTVGMLEEALRQGADLVGGCPYTDPDPAGHIRAILDLAQTYGVAADFHIDFDLDPQGSDLPVLIAETEARRLGGRITVGHATKLSAMAPAAVEEMAARLVGAGIGVVVLPATDLFLLGRTADRLAPRGIAPVMRLAQAGVATAIASNNVLNPFTPYGDASLLRMANLCANALQLSSEPDLAAVFDMVSAGAARLVSADHGLVEEGPADIVLLDAPDAVSALRGVAPTRAGWKRGLRTFARPQPVLLRPNAAVSRKGARPTTQANSD